MLNCTYDLKLYTLPFFISGQTYKISKDQIIIAPLYLELTRKVTLQ